MNNRNDYPIHLLFICIIIIITITLITFRIVLFYFEFPELIESSKDYDYILLYKGMENGLINFYDPIKGYDWPPYYLYFWYFLFFPMYLIPIEIGVYIWDGVRLILGIYIYNEARKIFKNQLDLFIFYLLSTISYSLDAYYNNCNFLIAFFLFSSYHLLDHKKRWYSGILFALSTFKINSILFIPILLLARKIKLKHLKYYFLPFFIICIPYIIFPQYFMLMLNNWLHQDDFIHGFTIIDSIFWKALQPSHLMTCSLFLLIFFENIKSEKKKTQFKLFVLPIMLLYYVYLTSIVFIIPLIFS